MERTHVKARKKIVENKKVTVDKVSSGAILHAPTVSVEKVTSGGIVVATRIEDLSEITSGGIVICEHCTTTPDIHSRGSMFNSIDEAITELETHKQSLSQNTPEELSIEENLDKKITKLEKLNTQ